MKINWRPKNYLRTYDNKSVAYIIQYTYIHSYFRIYTEYDLHLNVIKLYICKDTDIDQSYLK